MFTMFDMIECFVSFYGNVDTKSQLDHSWTRNESCFGRITYNDKEVNNNKTHHSQVDKARRSIAKCCHTWHPHFTSLVDRAERSKRGTYLPATHRSLLGKGMTKATHRKPATLLCWCLWLPVSNVSVASQKCIYPDHPDTSKPWQLSQVTDQFTSCCNSATWSQRQDTSALYSTFTQRKLHHRRPDNSAIKTWK